MTPNNEQKLLYKTIAEQIETAKEKYQQVLMVGDRKPYSRQQKNNIKKGRQLKRIIDKYNLSIINANEIKCKGKWTREQAEEISVIDYVITSP